MDAYKRAVVGIIHVNTSDAMCIFKWVYLTNMLEDAQDFGYPFSKT